MKTIILQVSDDFHSDIKQKAQLTERSVSQYVRDLLVTGIHPFSRVANLKEDPSCLNPS